MDPRDAQQIFGDLYPQGTRFDRRRMSILLSVPLAALPDGASLDAADSDDELEEDDGDPCGRVTLRALVEVCPLCNGKGTHVDPAIDAHGISSEEFAEDPEFAEEYMAGTYDQKCARCHGETTVLVPDPQATDPIARAALRWLAGWQREERADRRQRAHEMTMGY